MIYGISRISRIKTDKGKTIRVYPKTKSRRKIRFMQYESNMLLCFNGQNILIKSINMDHVVSISYRNND